MVVTIQLFWRIHNELSERYGGIQKNKGDKYHIPLVTFTNIYVFYAQQYVDPRNPYDRRNLCNSAHHIITGQR
jgi:hypothetical protein